MNHQMRVKAASVTSKVNAWMRALGTFEKDETWKCPDELAIAFLNPIERFSLKFFLTRKMLKKKFVENGNGGYQYQLARTTLFDDVFKQALGDGVEQIVLLGAGYDTRSYRFQDALNRITVFEVDMAATQHVKKTCLQKARIEIPDNVTFVELDLIEDNLEKGLLKAGYTKASKTLFVCEGILMYLTEASANAIFEFVKTHSQTGSAIVFDAVFKSALGGGSEYYGAKEATEWVERVGEKFTFGIEEGGLEAFLAQKGFNLIRYYDPELLEKEFLVNRNGESLGKMLGFLCAGVADH